MSGPSATLLLLCVKSNECWLRMTQRPFASLSVAKGAWLQQQVAASIELRVNDPLPCSMTGPPGCPSGLQARPCFFLTGNALIYAESAARDPLYPFSASQPWFQLASLSRNECVHEAVLKSIAGIRMSHNEVTFFLSG